MGICESTKNKPNFSDEVNENVNPFNDNPNFKKGNDNRIEEQKLNDQSNTNNKANYQPNTGSIQKGVNMNYNFNQVKPFPKGKATLLRKKQGKDISSDTLKQVIEVYINIKKTPIMGKYETKLTIYENNKEPFEVATLSEQSSDSNGEINYSDCVEMNYYFERDQKLEIMLREVNSDNVVYLECNMATVACALKGSTTVKHVDLDYQIEIIAKTIKSEKKNYNFNIKVEDPSNKLSHKELYLVFKNFNDNKNWRGVYKSEESSNNSFDSINIAEDDLFLGDSNKNFLIELQSHSQPIIEGFVETCMNDLISNDKKLQLIGLDGSATEVYLDMKIEVIEKTSFTDLLSKGMQISLIVAVDFTASNNYYDKPSSLHYIAGDQPNGYEKAMRSCGSAIAYYDYDQDFPLLGFGGVPENGNKVEHVFPLNYSENPNVHGIENMIRVYKESLPRTHFSGPTNFSPFLNKVKSIVEKTNGVYTVVMILTDGMISDLQNTIDSIVECSRYPLSIIIVGIGNADFSSMETLDGDDMPLTDSQGRSVARDIVQFVPFKEVGNDEDKLRELVLMELPGQIETFYTQRKFI